MTSVAVVKPDHLGDFVLSIPALRALMYKFGRYDLYALPSNRFLLNHFIPDGPTLHGVRLAHLQKEGGGEGVSGLVSRLKRYTVVVFLRDDGFCREVAHAIGGGAFVPNGMNELHETKIQKNVVSQLVGDYSRTALMWQDGVATRWPREIRCVGISLSAGFFANKIPFMTWLRLASALSKKHNLRIKLIGGPLEVDELLMMKRMLCLRDVDVIVGGGDLTVFYKHVAECDAVVGADSGTLHLLSVRVPVLGVFTSSPWQRYSPFGRANRVLYPNVACSPCIQFSKDAYNGCLSRECAALVSAEDIEEALLIPEEYVDRVKIGSLMNLVIGPSHV